LIAKFCNRAFSWMVLLASYSFVITLTIKAVEDYFKTTNAGVDIADIATGGIVAIGKRVLIAVIAGGIMSLLVAFLSATSFGLLRESPFLHSGILGGALWLMEKFIPLTLGWHMFLACIIYALVLWAAKLVAMLAMKLIPIVLLCFAIQSVSAGVVSFTVRNGTGYSVHLDLSGSGSAPELGLTAPPGESVEVAFDPVASGVSTNSDVRLWYKSGVGSWAGGSALGSWDSLKLSDDGVAAAKWSFAEVPGSPPVFAGLEIEHSSFWSFYQGWYLGVGLFGAGLSLYIVRKIRGNPSEL
jgi:hypothetical protein